MLEKHLLASKRRPICYSITNLFGNKVKCFYLHQKEKGWYECFAFGFPPEKPGVGGICKQEKWRILYDYDKIVHKKCIKYNFCPNRLIAPILLIISLVGLGTLLKIKEIIGSFINK